jgi:hypothetical protein
MADSGLSTAGGNGAWLFRLMQKVTEQAELRSSYLYASAGEFDELEWRTVATATTRLIYEGVTGDPIEGSVEIQTVGQNWRSDHQWSRAVANILKGPLECRFYSYPGSAFLPSSSALSDGFIAQYPRTAVRVRACGT